MPPTAPTDAQLVRAILELHEYNVSEVARQLDIRRETVARWRDKGARLKLFAKDRKRILMHLIERRGY